MRGLRCRHNLLFVRSEEAYTFLVVFTQDMQAQEVGRARLGASTGDDGDDLAIAHIAMLFEQTFRNIDKRLSRVDLRAANQVWCPTAGSVD